MAFSLRIDAGHVKTYPPGTHSDIYEETQSFFSLLTTQNYK